MPRRHRRILRNTAGFVLAIVPPTAKPKFLPHQAADTSSVSICVYNAPMVANVVFLILGAVIGIALGYFFAASRKTVTTDTDNSELITLRQNAASSRTQVEELTRRLEDAEHRAAGLIQFQTQAAAAQRVRSNWKSSFLGWSRAPSRTPMSWRF